MKSRYLMRVAVVRVVFLDSLLQPFCCHLLLTPCTLIHPNATQAFFDRDLRVLLGYSGSSVTAHGVHVQQHQHMYMGKYP